MFDDLRRTVSDDYEQIGDTPVDKLVNDADVESFTDQEAEETPSDFMGMSAPQRFVIALMFFFMVLVLGCFFLVLSGKIVLPIF